MMTMIGYHPAGGVAKDKTQLTTVVEVPRAWQVTMKHFSNFNAVTLVVFVIGLILGGFIATQSLLVTEKSKDGSPCINVKCECWRILPNGELRQRQREFW
jgi:hypothetical protein